METLEVTIKGGDSSKKIINGEIQDKTVYTIDRRYEADVLKTLAVFHNNTIEEIEKEKKEQTQAKLKKKTSEELTALEKMIEKEGK